MTEIVPVGGGGGSNRRGGGGTNNLDDRDSNGSNKVRMDRGQKEKGEEDVGEGYDEKKKKTGDCYVTFCYKL